MQRQERHAAVALERAADAKADLLAIHQKTEERFGRDVPPDAFLLDVLDLIEVREGDRWIWRGRRNNLGLPSLRVERGEKSLARFLAIQFGVITEEEFGVMYPNDGDADDVNPFHRTFRATGIPIGNVARYRFGDVLDEVDA